MLRQRYARRSALTVILSVVLTAPVALGAQPPARCVTLAAPESIDPDRRWFDPLPTDSAAACPRRPRVALLSPELRLVHRSGIPDPRAQGAGLIWNGGNLHARVGTDLRWRRLTLRLAPELAVTQNASFPRFRSIDGFWIGGPPAPTDRSLFSSPWYFGPVSADLPSRPGDAPIGRLHPGASGVWVAWPSLSLGVTARQPRWGPDVGESLVLGSSTAGIPRMEASVHHRTGAVEHALRWFSGVAVESRFFDGAATNDRRAIAGARLEERVGGWRLGVSRTVMDGRQARTGLEASDLPFRKAPTDSIIDLLAVDLRFVAPDAQGTIWLEAVRQVPLHSARDLARYPTEGIAFRLGFDQRVVRTARAEWRGSVEMVRLDQPLQRAGISPPDLYTSPTVVHGWTHLGAPLGSGLGPGGQRQLLGAERRGGTWRSRVFVERARWNDDALYRQFQPNWWRHDVSYHLGVWAGRALNGHEVGGHLLFGRRTNYLFQNDTHVPFYQTMDRTIWQLGVSLGPSTAR